MKSMQEDTAKTRRSSSPTRWSAGRKLALLGCCAALSGPAAAQSVDLDFYGKLYPEVLGYDVKGGTGQDAPVSSLARPGQNDADYSGSALESSNSRVGVRGSLPLGENGLKAIFQLETTVPIDSGTKSSNFWNRDSYVGLAGRYGTLKVGLLDTVYKTMAENASFLSVSSGNFVSISNIIARQGFGTSSASSFHLRRSNSIYYESPVYNGFQGLVQYSIGEKSDKGDPNQWLASFGIQYDTDALHVAVAHEVHHDFFGGTLNMPTAELRSTEGKSSRDVSSRFTVKYTFPSRTRVDVNYARTKFNEHGGTAGSFKSYEHDSYSIGLRQPVGKWAFAAQYGVAERGRCALIGSMACSTDGLDGTMTSVGASYSLSKQFSLFGLYSYLRNGASAVYSNLGDAPPVTTGADIQQVALGVSFSF